MLLSQDLGRIRRRAGDCGSCSPTHPEATRLGTTGVESPCNPVCSDIGLAEFNGAYSQVNQIPEVLFYSIYIYIYSVCVPMHICACRGGGSV